MTLTASIRNLILSAMCLTTVGCQHHSFAPMSAFVWHDPHVTHRLRYGGTRCEFDDRSIHLGSPSYPIEAIGKPETPSVGSGDRSLVREIRRDAPHLRFLRFTYLSGAFVIFDAPRGPCSTDPEQVLNDGCNAYYRPGEATDSEFAAPSCLAHPRPWIMNDGGNPTSPSWDTIHDDGP